MNQVAASQQKDEIEILIATLEWLAKNPEEPLEDWRKAIWHVLNENEEKMRSGYVIPEYVISDESKSIQEEKAKFVLSMTKEVEKIINELRSRLIPLEKIINYEKSNLENQIWEVFSKRFWKSAYFSVPAAFLVLAFIFAGFGSFQLQSGAQKAGDLVNEMNKRVMAAYEKIEKVTVNAENIMQKKIEKEVLKISGDIKQNVNAKTVTFVDNKLAQTFKENTISDQAKKRIELTTENRTKSALEKMNIKGLIESTLKNNVDNEIKRDLSGKIKNSLSRESIDDRIDKFVKPKVDVLDNAQVESSLEIALHNAVFEIETEDSIRKKIVDRIGFVINKSVDRVVKNKSFDQRMTDAIGKKVGKLDTSKIDENIRKVVYKTVTESIDKNYPRGSMAQIIDNEIKDKAGKSFKEEINTLSRRVRDIKEQFRYVIPILNSIQRLFYALDSDTNFGSIEWVASVLDVSLFILLVGCFFLLCAMSISVHAWIRCRRNREEINRNRNEIDQITAYLSNTGGSTA